MNRYLNSNLALTDNITLYLCKELNKIDKKGDLKHITVKPVLSRHSRIDKTKVLKTNGSLMKVESIAECNTFDLH